MIVSEDDMLELGILELRMQLCVPWYEFSCLVSSREVDEGLGWRLNSRCVQSEHTVGHRCSPETNRLWNNTALVWKGLDRVQNVATGQIPSEAYFRVWEGWMERKPFSLSLSLFWRVIWSMRLKQLKITHWNCTVCHTQPRNISTPLFFRPEWSIRLGLRRDGQRKQDYKRRISGALRVNYLFHAVENVPYYSCSPPLENSWATLAVAS